MHLYLPVDDFIYYFCIEHATLGASIDISTAMRGIAVSMGSRGRYILI